MPYNLQTLSDETLEALLPSNRLDPNGKHIQALYLQLKGSDQVLSTSQTGTRENILQTAKATHTVLQSLSNTLTIVAHLVVPTGWKPGDPIELVAPFTPETLFPTVSEIEAEINRRHP